MSRETRAHRRLKTLAVAFLREHGCLIAAEEVRCPISRYRVDVAGYLDTIAEPPDPTGPALVEPPEPRAPSSRSRRRAPRTVLIECKQSRADFFRDRRNRDRLIQTRETLREVKAGMERDRLRRAEPDLQHAASLFGDLMPETEEWNFAASRSPAYRDLLTKLRRLDRLIHGETKFHLVARYALADRLYIAAPRGLLRPRDVPPGWGLLECARSMLERDETEADLFGDSIMMIRRPAPPLRSSERFRAALLRNIAVAACSAAAPRTASTREASAQRKRPSVRRAARHTSGLDAP